MKRDFEYLIREIEIEGETIIPIQEIAKLAFNCNKQTVENNSKKWVNDGYDRCAWYTFETNFFTPKKHEFFINIDRKFNISMNFRIDGYSHRNIGMPVHNQIEIFRLLQKLEFIDIEINSKIKEIENWLIVNTSLEIEKIVDFKEKFMN